MTQTTSYVNRSAACGAWRNLAGDDNDHESCTGQVSLPPPDDVCRCHCHGVRVGSFFICSWGYDQTNVDFYRVESLSASGKTAKVALWSSNHTVDGRHVVPGDGPRENFEHGTNRWLEVGDTITKRLRPPHTVGHDRWSFFVTDYADAYLWDGRPAHETPIGEGH